MTDFTVEMSRADQAERDVPVARRYAVLVERLRGQLAAGGDPFRVAGIVGSGLWQRAVGDVQDGFLDDRALYWGRLAAHRCLQEAGHACGEALERASRGLSEVAVDAPTLLLAGFDPFHLDRDISQSNPSGTVALALHGNAMEGANDQRLTVQSAILPVRFADFDAGIVERLLSERCAAGGVRMVVTVSMGRDAFDLERFPGRRRSSPNPDNERRLGGGTAEEPLVPRGLDGPEFLEFSLPAVAMAAVDGRWAVRDNHRVTTVARGRLEAESVEDLTGETAVEGSGGGYLSNEVAYRTLLSAERHGLDLPIGHVHVPALRGHDAGWERDIVNQVRRMIAAGVRAVTS
ncbi:MAG: hypothetical protein F4Y01_09195 [Gammaproteobacteria bacterium]|nr:hypothetical protein [Gammaproteobacteria bacterium]